MPHPVSPDSELAGYSAAVAASFAASQPRCAVSYQLAGCTISLRAPDPRLLDQMTRALAHLPQVEGQAADLSVGLWAGAPAPTSPIGWYAQHAGQGAGRLLEGPLDARGELPLFNSARVHTSFHLRPSNLHLLDVTRNSGYFWAEGRDSIPYYLQSSPLHTILGWWFSRRDLTIVHAGAVGLPSGGVLFVGQSGAGKSSCALACLKSPLFYAGDDYCLVGGDPPQVHSLYNSAKLKGPADLERFPDLAPFVRNMQAGSAEKRLLFAHEVYPGRTIGQFPLRALLIPRLVGAARARLVPASAAAALQAMAPSTVAQLPGSARGAFHRLVRLAHQVPAYILELGPDVARIPELVQKLLNAEGVSQ